MCLADSEEGKGAETSAEIKSLKILVRRLSRTDRIMKQLFFVASSRTRSAVKFALIRPKSKLYVNFNHE